MHFSKISVTKKGVHLIHETRAADGTVDTVDTTSPVDPLPSFVDALQSFKPYVVELLPFAIEQDALTITTLNLSADKNGLRGLIVTATTPVPKAYDKPLVLNMPLVREGGENPSADAFILSDEVLELIGLAESEATRYAKGERAQGELFGRKETSATSANAAAADERMAAAEVASTRKPKGKRPPKDQVLGVGTIANPEKTAPPTNQQLAELLLKAGKTVPLDAIARWISSERDQAQRWAELSAKGSPGNMPLCVQRDAVRMLTESQAAQQPPRTN